MRLLAGIYHAFFIKPLVCFYGNHPRMYLPRVVSYGHTRVVRIAVVTLICTSVILTLRLRASRPRQPSIYDYTDGKPAPENRWQTPNGTARSEEVEYLDYIVQTYSLSNEVTWYAPRIQPSYSAGKWLSMTKISKKFLPGDFVRARVDDEDLELPRGQQIKLPVAKSARNRQAADASSLMFGISTTYARLIYSNNSLIKDWERWLTDGNGNSNGGSLLLTLHQASKEEVSRASGVLRSLGIDVTVQRSVDSGDATSRYIELVHLLKKYSTAFTGGDRSKKYLALADDDVFFPSMSKLVEKLSKFSPTKEYYIGAPSDRSDWVVENNETFTYGGGAVFLTPPMIQKLSQLPCLEQDGGDGKSKKGSQWDLSLYDCVISESEENLQVLPSYHAPEDEEAYGDRGISNQGYSAGIQPLTLHHYKNWHRFEAGRGHLVTSVCGEDCFLQRFRFRDGWILVNGYAISHYPDGVDALPLRKETRAPSKPIVPEDGGEEAEEEEWEEVEVAVSDRLVVDKPDRPSDMSVVAWRGRKRTWRLLDAKIGPNGEVWQAYVKRRGGGNWFGEGEGRMPGDTVHSEEEKSVHDSVIVLIWEP